ncbi:MAG: PLP-dependent aminotransferase family protein [Pseudomonadota bacterium]
MPIELDTAARPHYRALADQLCAAIAQGKIADGTKLPPVRTLAFDLGISPGAVARAYKLGVERGALEATVGRGTFVRADSAGAPRFAMDALLGPVAGLKDSSADAPVASNLIDLRGNQAMNVGQDAMIGAALQRILTAHGTAPPLTDYHRREDTPHFLGVLAGWLRRQHVPAVADRLLVTSGAQAGVIAAMGVVCRGGTGVVLTSDTMHPGTRDGITALGIRLEAVTCDEQGILPDALSAACARFRPDAVKLTATLNNPTLAVMGLERRRAVAEVLTCAGVPMIEDDVYGQLMDTPPPTFASLLPDLCWYVTSLSKCVAAGLRAGFVLCPPGRTTATLRAYQAFAHQTPWLVKALASELVEAGDAETIRQRVAAETAVRAKIAARLLGPFGARTHPAASFAYLPMPPGWSSAELVAAAAGRGVLLAPSHSWIVGRSADFVRVALGPRLGREALADALTRIAALLREGPNPAAVMT